MNQNNFHEYTTINTLEDYSKTLSLSILSLISLHNYQVTVLKKGLLPDEDHETANLISWEIKKLLEKYKLHLNHVLNLFDSEEMDDEKFIQKQAKKLIKKRKKEK